MKKTAFGKASLAAVVAAACLVFAPMAMAADPHAVDSGKSAVEVLHDLLKGNEKFTKSHDARYFESYQKGQTPSVTMISCADSRVQTDMLSIDPTNNVFMIRNIGNQVQNAEGSVDYGIRHLPTKILVIMGHSGCGAIKAAMSDYSKETPGIKMELKPLAGPLAADDGRGDFNERWAKNIERNVDYQVAYAKKLYADKVNSGDLTIVGAIYDFNDTCGKGKGSVVITNINGETEPDKIASQPVMQHPETKTIAKIGDLAPACDFDPPVAYGYTPPEKH